MIWNCIIEIIVYFSSFAVSIFALGGMIGGLCGGFITDRFGR
jgi:MFS family permease